MPIQEALQVCGIPQVQPFNREGINNVEDFAQLTDEDAIEMAKSMAARPTQRLILGAIQIKRPRGLAFWARKLSLRQLPIADDAFTVDTMRDSIRELDAGERGSRSQEASQTQPRRVGHWGTNV